MPSTTTIARLLLYALLVAVAPPTAGRAAEPLTIGFDTAATGGLAPNGKAAPLAMQIWDDDTNAKGGLLGRPVKLITYDDQSNPAPVPGIVTKLLDVDKVDILIGGNGTNLVAPALPVVMPRQLTFLGLFGLDVNSEFHYDRYFSIIPAGGSHPKEAFSQGFFAVAEAMTPKPRVLAVQFQGVQGHDLERFRDPRNEVILWPPTLKSGELRAPYNDAKH